MQTNVFAFKQLSRLSQVIYAVSSTLARRQGMDAIEYFAALGSSARVKMFYAVVENAYGHSNPYELEVVPREETRGRTYFTISAAGLAQVWGVVGRRACVGSSREGVEEGGVAGCAGVSSEQRGGAKVDEWTWMRQGSGAEVSRWLDSDRK
eukprot:320083-Chlamydomonas_euryale.AAC.1